MARIDYSEFYETGKDLIEEFGSDAVLRKLVGKKTVSYDGIAVRLRYSEEIIGSNDNIINAGDVKFICQFPTAPSAMKDLIVFGGKSYNVISVDEICPDGSTVLLYIVQTRRT